MADSKRNSMAGKVATPKVGAQGMVEMDAALVKAVGARVRITSALESLNVLEGTIFSVDPITNVIAINTATPSPNPNSNTTNLPGNYHVLCFSSIQSYELLSLPTEADRAEGYGPGFDGALPSIEKLDMAALRAREEEAIRKLKEQDRRRGKGVTKEAQALFDDLIKVYSDTRWAGQSIIVLDNVRIDPPYTAEKVTGGPQAPPESVPRIRKMVTGTREKLQKEQREKAKGSSGGNRPGVATPTMPPRKGG